MTIDETISMVKFHVRNFFNANNSASEPPEASAKYDLFLALCGEINAFIESDEGKPSALVSEHNASYSLTAATGKDGTPLSWQDLYKSRLDIFRLHIYRS